MRFHCFTFCSPMNNINFDLEMKNFKHEKSDENEKKRAKIEKKKKTKKERKKQRTNNESYFTNMIALSVGDDLFPGSSKSFLSTIFFHYFSHRTFRFDFSSRRCFLSTVLFIMWDGICVIFVVHPQILP